MTMDAAPKDLTLHGMSVQNLVDALGEKIPTPGGGAVASIIAALGAALGRMVVAYSAGKKSLADHAELHDEALGRLRQLADRALDLAAEDERAYGLLNELMKLDRDDPRRSAEWADAVDGAVAVPREVMALCMGLMNLLHRLAGTTNRMLDSDLVIAAILADAGANAGAWNVRINLPLIDDPALIREIISEIERLLSRITRLRADIEARSAAES